MRNARILKDIQLCKTKFKEDLEGLDIHYHFNENNISYCTLLIIGPVKKYDSELNIDYNTPYFGGYYVFTIKYTENFPVEPPKMGFKSAFEKWRCHPNFYEIGCGELDKELGTKVC